MIGVRLRGGLGNQLFQYAAARALASVRSTEVVADVSHYKTDRKRRYLLERLVACPRIANPEELAGLRLCREKSFRFDSLAGAKDGSLLDGYWQSYRYFDSIREMLLKELRPGNPSAAASSASEISGLHSVSVHVRRGDYASDPLTNRYHGLCGVDYYQAAIERVTKLVPEARFFLFSDDPGWTEKHVLPLAPHGRLVGPHANEEDDLWLISLCHHHIIANSSFSWWGSWLSKNPSKITCAPKQWFAGAGLDTSDLIPETWTRI